MNGCFRIANSRGRRIVDGRLEPVALGPAPPARHDPKPPVASVGFAVKHTYDKKPARRLME
jgi:hypothetical protein